MEHTLLLTTRQTLGFFYHKISWSLLGHVGVTCYVQAKNTFTKCKHLNSLPYGKQKLLVCHIFGL